MATIAYWNHATLALSSTLLVSSAAIWISLSGIRPRLFSLAVLFLIQIINTSLAGSAALVAQLHFSALAISFLSLSLLWILLTLAQLPGAELNTETLEPKP